MRTTRKARTAAAPRGGHHARKTVPLAFAATLLAAAIASTTLAQPVPVAVTLPADVEADGGMTPGPPDRAAIVVVLDGARWQDVLLGVDGELARDAGLDVRAANEPTMPRLQALAKAHGAVFGAPGSGTALYASGPNFVSLPGYTEILGGRRPTGCTGNDCPPTTRETLLDAAARWSDSPADVALFASWPELVRVAAARPEALVVSAGRTLTQHEGLLRRDAPTADLLDRGERALAWPGDGDYRPDRFTAPLATRYVEAVHPRLLFLSLGDTDEYAHRSDYAGYLQALRFDDDVIADLAAAVDRAGPRGRKTTIYVTADHGRALDFRDHGGKWPESSRVWLFAIGDVAVGVPRNALDERRLADVAPTVRAWLGLPEDDALDTGRAIGALLPSR